LLQFLLKHPHRYFSVAQILAQAWANPSLFPEEVRTYIRRLRKLMVALQVPCDIVNQPQRGYCLRFREDEERPAIIEPPAYLRQRGGAMEKSQTKPRSRQGDKLPRVLVVDANAGYRSVISHVVELAGGEFESVAEFDAARRQIERPRKFDLVILGMSADARVSPKQLGELRAAAGCPFILLDESSDEAGETLETYEAGASQIMPKPFVPDALIGAIKAELRGPDLASVVAIATKIELEGLVFDAKQRTVTSANDTVSLTKREWQLP